MERVLTQSKGKVVAEGELELTYHLSQSRVEVEVVAGLIQQAVEAEVGQVVNHWRVEVVEEEEQLLIQPGVETEVVVSVKD